MSSTKFLEANNEQKIQELQRGNQGTPHKQTQVAANLSCKKKRDIKDRLWFIKREAADERESRNGYAFRPFSLPTLSLVFLILFCV